MRIRLHKQVALIFLALLFISSCEENSEISLHTGSAPNVMYTTLWVEGSIIEAGDGIIEYGHFWSENPTPTIADNITSDGTGLGLYTSSITGLSPSTSYYVRAYATNAAGTVYGEEIDFITPAEDGETVTDYDVAIELANDSDFGLAAYIWTQDINKALQCARRIDAGRVWVNSALHGSLNCLWEARKCQEMAVKPGALGLMSMQS